MSILLKPSDVPNSIDVEVNEADITFTKGNLSKNSGSFSNSRNFISSTNTVFEDEHYYQLFSYVLKSNIPLEQYESFFKLLVHPAGMKSFHQLIVSSFAENPVSVPRNQILEKIFKTFIDYEMKSYEFDSPTINRKFGDFAITGPFVRELDSVQKFIFNSRPIAHFKKDKIKFWMDSDSNPNKFKRTVMQPDTIITRYDESGIVAKTTLGQQIPGR